MDSEDRLDPTITALTTLSLLHARLARLEHIILGRTKPSHQANNVTKLVLSPKTIPTQMSDLEARLNGLRHLDGVSGSMVRMIENLRREHPEIFKQPSLGSASSGSDGVAASSGSAQDGTTTTSSNISTQRLAKQAVEVLAHQATYTSTSAQLQTLQTLQIPPAQNSAVLIEQEPRIVALRERQNRLEREIDALRARSAQALEWWVRTGVVGIGEVVEDWEARVVDCDRAMRRLQRQKYEEERLLT